LASCRQISSSLRFIHSSIHSSIHASIHALVSVTTSYVAVGEGTSTGWIFGRDRVFFVTCTVSRTSRTMTTTGEHSERAICKKVFIIQQSVILDLSSFSKNWTLITDRCQPSPTIFFLGREKRKTNFYCTVLYTIPFTGMQRRPTTDDTPYTVPRTAYRDKNSSAHKTAFESMEVD
jgi:hypothetical protein